MIPGAGSPGRLLLDGAMGTALQARGLAPHRLPEEWLLERPSEIAAVHRAHARAGAGLLLTCTFNAARLEAAGLQGLTGELCARAVEAARRARGAGVAGCVGATGLARPDGAGPPDGELRERFLAPFRALCAAGVDLLWTETHVALREARAAVASARRCGLPVVATVFLAPGEDGALAALDGAPGEEWLEVLWRDGAAAVGVNCVAPGPALAALVGRAVSRIPVPLAVKPSAGLPGGLLPPATFAAATEPALRAGARLAGGCCGAGAGHLRALGARLARA
jgi:5-methyltetrahydrofolate--homocysteine methyltransferase